MKRRLLLGMSIIGLVVGGYPAETAVTPHLECARAALPSRNDALIFPDSTNAVQFRLYTNAAPEASHRFNTFEIVAYGEHLLSSPAGAGLQRWLTTSPTTASLDNILINGAGPQLALTNSMTILEAASGPDWRYVAYDASQAYHGILEKFHRGILFVQPDLFVLYDQVVAKEPVELKMQLQLPAATRLDPIWRDLRLELPHAGLRINSPASRHALRAWEAVESTADSFLPGTRTLQLRPTNRLTQLNLLTVFVVYPGGTKKDFAFKLLESHSAVGARIHREALPTLVAFKTGASTGSSSLTGFEFTGPVGVSVFRPTRKAP